MDESDSQESPPVWRKPSEIMKLRRKRKSSAKLRVTPGRDGNKNCSPGWDDDDKSLSWRKPGQKRLNPFGCSPRKRINMHGSSGTPESEYDSPSQSPLFGVLNRSSFSETTDSPTSRMSIADINRAMTAVEKKAKNDEMSLEDASEASQEEDNINTSIKLITDWSVKTKARFISPQPFNWFMQLKTTEESTGLAEYTRACPDHVNERVEDPTRSTEAKIDAQKHSLYWQHPSLPWLRLFPRNVPDHKVGKIGSTHLSEEIQTALRSDWNDSFMSVFNQLRGGRCPYFYMCAHQFTVLFRAAGVGGKNSPHAIMTPTSRGIRESLRKEDIEFSMPLVGNKPLIGEGGDRTMEESTPTTPVIGDGATEMKENERPPPGEEAEEDDDDDITTTDDGATSFLETLGLDSKRYRSLDPNKIKMQRESFRMIDHRAESLVLVEGGDTQALFNFLLNCQSCFASSGVQAGIPPTLFSPSPFKGAMLKSLRYKTNTIRPNNTTGNTTRWYSLEAEGTMLPHSLQGLARLFSQTQEEFSVTFNSCETTFSLNAVTADTEVFSENDSSKAFLEKTDIQPSHIDSLVSDTDLGKNAIRGLTYRDGQYTWTV